MKSHVSCWLPSRPARRAAMLLVVALSMVGSTAVRAQSEESEQTAVDPVSFGVLRAPTGAMAPVADEHGWFEEAGVEVDLKSFAEGGGPAIIQAMGGGQPDLALLNLATTVLALGQGAFDVQIVSVGANPAPALPIIATEEITSVEDLRGKRVSAPPNGGLYYILAATLEKFGLTFDDIDYLPLSAGDGQAAFFTGQLDAVVTSVNGSVTLLNEAPGAHALWDGTKFDPEDAFANPDVLIATPGAVESNPEGIRRFLSALQGQAVPYLNDPATHDQAITEVNDYLNSVGAGLELEATRQATESIDFYDAEAACELLTSEAFRESVEKQVDFWISVGVLEEPVDVGAALNPDMICP